LEGIHSEIFKNVKNLTLSLLIELLLNPAQVLFEL